MYPTGFDFDLAVRRHPRHPRQRHDRVHRWGDELRLEVRFADGRRVDNDPRRWPAHPATSHPTLTCTMSGFPAVQLLDARGRVIATLPGNDATNPVVRLRPGGSASFGIGQLLNPDYPGQSCPHRRPRCS